LFKAISEKFKLFEGKSKNDTFIKYDMNIFKKNVLSHSDER